MLHEAGYLSGLYTSPHILRFNERIRTGKNEIPDDELVSIADSLFKKAESLGCTFFEITTAIAFKYFADKKIDVAVVETGMGGRFDSTNVIDPIASIITGIDLDHTEYLGTSLNEIAMEKAGIIKPQSYVIIGEKREELQDYFAKTATEQHARCVFIEDKYETENFTFSSDFTMKFDLNTPYKQLLSLPSPLAGIHQAQNIVMAVAALEALTDI